MRSSAVGYSVDRAVLSPCCREVPSRNNRQDQGAEWESSSEAELSGLWEYASMLI
jgi:hypothetical protein